jgi:hypothetical protein
VGIYLLIGLWLLFLFLSYALLPYTNPVVTTEVLYDQELSLNNIEMRVTPFTTEHFANPDLPIFVTVTDFKMNENSSIIILFLFDENFSPPTNPFNFAEVNNATHPNISDDDNGISGFFIRGNQTLQSYEEYESEMYELDKYWYLSNYVYFPFANNDEDPYKFQMIIYHLGEGNSQFKMIIEQVDFGIRPSEIPPSPTVVRNTYLIFLVIWSIPILIYFWAIQYVILD